MIPSSRTYCSAFGLSLVLLAMLPACSVLKTPQAARQWLLDPIPVQAEKAASAPALAHTDISVQWPRLSPPYDQDRVWIAQNGELLALKGVRWRADVPVLLQDAVQQTLRASARFAAVHTTPTESDWHLELLAPDFRAVQADNGYRINLQLVWRLQCTHQTSLSDSGTAYGSAFANNATDLRDAFLSSLNAALSELEAGLLPVDLNACQAQTE